MACLRLRFCVCLRLRYLFSPMGGCQIDVVSTDSGFACFVWLCLAVSGCVVIYGCMAVYVGSW